MAWASLGSLGSNNATNGDPISIAIGTAVAVGRVIVVHIASDYPMSASTVTDTAGNVYKATQEISNSNGAVAAFWFSLTSVALLAGDSITVTFSLNEPSLVAVSAWHYSVASGSTISKAGSTSVLGDGIDPPAMTISGLVSGEYLFTHTLAIDLATALVGYVEDANYTAVTGDGTGLGGDNISVRGGFRILAATGDTVDCSAAVADTAQLFFALLETLAAPAATGLSVSVIEGPARMGGLLW
jgi:hypothetical protein